MSNIYNDKLESLITALGATPEAEPAGNIYVARLDQVLAAIEAGGTVGPEGPEGPAGADGTPGTQGIQGIQGPAGTPGTPGTPGTQGIQGPAGTPGTPGTPGTQGIQGIQGPAGTPGTQGIQGIQGPAGTTTWSGITGKPTTIAGYGLTDAAPKTGVGASGTWPISISGTAPYAIVSDFTNLLNIPTTLAGYGITIQGWISLSLTNGWLNYGGGFNAAGYWRDPFGVVHLRGFIKSGALGQAACTLPAGYRPAANEGMATVANGAFGFLQITSAGLVIPSSPSSNVWFSLDNVTFRAA
jgi:hypothetical protein